MGKKTRQVDALTHQLWAQFRLAVIGELLCSPPERGQLKKKVRALGKKKWLHPLTGGLFRISSTSIERWFYKARKYNQNPIDSLANKVRVDWGENRKIDPCIVENWRDLYVNHPHWTYLLLYDNLVALMKMKDPSVPIPSYSTMRRHSIRVGQLRQRKPVCHDDGTPISSAAAAADYRRSYEVRSYEVEYVGGLWHLDFHKGSKKILMDDGLWQQPILLCILDDCSRLVCHIQWYLSETAACLVHGYSQALLKRGIPRALLTDNGSAMISHEFTEGLMRLSTQHDRTLAYSPYQNGKQERFWGTVEGRLLPMLEDVRALSLDQLNYHTQVWVESDYHEIVHTETKQTPVQRFVNHQSVLRESPSLETLKSSFTREQKRIQRIMDGTISCHGMRYEVPSAYRHHKNLWIRSTSWDLSHIYLCEPKERKPILRIFPVDKQANSQMGRARNAPIAQQHKPIQEHFDKISPLLQKLVNKHTEQHLPPSYLSYDELTKNQEKKNEPT